MSSRSPLRVAFMGTPTWSVPIVEALHQAYPVSVVYSQPPRPQNRGHQVQPSPVHIWAEEHGIHVETPASLRNPEAEATFHAHQFDWVVVAAYGLILPAYALAARHGATNVHASLLPRWRGAAPLHRALLAGDNETGVTIMQMDEGLDTGPMWSMAPYPITSSTTITQLHADTAKLGGELLVKTALSILSGNQKPQVQPTEGVTYANKITKDEGQLHFDRDSTSEIERRIRALAGWPGTYFDYADITYKVHAAHATQTHLAPGIHQLDGTQWMVGCANGYALSLDTLQKPGGKPMATAELLHGMEKKENI